MTDLSRVPVIVYDRGGLYTYWARAMGREFAETLYYIPDSSSYPESPKAQIGKGYAEIKRITDAEYYKAIKRIEHVFFPDCYDGAYQQALREDGHKVFGSGLSEKMEIDKLFFLEKLEELGLPLPYTVPVDGVDEMLDFLSYKKGDWYIKGLHRGDFESRKHCNMKQTLNWVNQYLLPKLGSRAKDIPILCQRGIKSKVEIGYDGNRVKGLCVDKCMVGVETKDKGYVCKVFAAPPPIIKKVNDAFNSIYQEFGYDGAYSNEIRVTEDGKAYPIDETTRVGSPPGELTVIQYKNYPEGVKLISEGEVPDFEEVASYGAQLIFTSSFHDDHEICVEFPKEYDQNVMLKNCVKRGGAHYCIPNGNGGFFGACAATGKTAKAAMDRCIEIAGTIECEEFQFNPDAFSAAQEAMEEAGKYGISFA